MRQGDSSRSLKALPLKFQQTSFNSAYMKAEAGIRELVTVVTCIALCSRMWAVCVIFL